MTEFLFTINEIVLAEWERKIFYAKILSINRKDQCCTLLFDDKSVEEVGFTKIYSVDATTQELVCVICKDGESSAPNEIVLCDKCSLGYHQFCHSPSIASEALKPTVPWKCSYCERRTPNPHTTNPFQKAIRRARPGFYEESEAANSRSVARPDEGTSGNKIHPAIWGHRPSNANFLHDFTREKQEKEGEKSKEVSHGQESFAKQAITTAQHGQISSALGQQRKHAHYHKRLQQKQHQRFRNHLLKQQEREERKDQTKEARQEEQQQQQHRELAKRTEGDLEVTTPETHQPLHLQLSQVTAESNAQGDSQPHAMQAQRTARLTKETDTSASGSMVTPRGATTPLQSRSQSSGRGSQSHFDHTRHSWSERREDGSPYDVTAHDLARSEGQRRSTFRHDDNRSAFDAVKRQAVYDAASLATPHSESKGGRHRVAHRGFVSRSSNNNYNSNNNNNGDDERSNDINGDRAEDSASNNNNNDDDIVGLKGNTSVRCRSPKTKHGQSRHSVLPDKATSVCDEPSAENNRTAARGTAGGRRPPSTEDHHNREPRSPVLDVVTETQAGSPTGSTRHRPTSLDFDAGRHSSTGDAPPEVDVVRNGSRPATSNPVQCEHSDLTESQEQRSVVEEAPYTREQHKEGKIADSLDPCRHVSLGDDNGRASGSPGEAGSTGRQQRNKTRSVSTDPAHEKEEPGANVERKGEHMVPPAYCQVAKDATAMLQYDWMNVKLTPTADATHQGRHHVRDSAPTGQRSTTNHSAAAMASQHAGVTAQEKSRGAYSWEQEVKSSPPLLHTSTHATEKSNSVCDSRNLVTLPIRIHMEENKLSLMQIKSDINLYDAGCKRPTDLILQNYAAHVVDSQLSNPRVSERHAGMMQHHVKPQHHQPNGHAFQPFQGGRTHSPSVREDVRHPQLHAKQALFPNREPVAATATANIPFSIPGASTVYRPRPIVGSALTTPTTINNNNNNNCRARDDEHAMAVMSYRRHGSRSYDNCSFPLPDKQQASEITPAHVTSVSSFGFGAPSERSHSDELLNIVNNRHSRSMEGGTRGLVEALSSRKGQPIRGLQQGETQGEYSRFLMALKSQHEKHTTWKHGSHDSNGKAETPLELAQMEQHVRGHTGSAELRQIMHNAEARKLRQAGEAGRGSWADREEAERLPFSNLLKRRGAASEFDRHYPRDSRLHQETFKEEMLQAREPTRQQQQQQQQLQQQEWLRGRGADHFQGQLQSTGGSRESAIPISTGHNPRSHVMTAPSRSHVMQDSPRVMSAPLRDGRSQYREHALEQRQPQKQQPTQQQQQQHFQHQQMHMAGHRLHPRSPTMYSNRLRQAAEGGLDIVGQTLRTGHHSDGIGRIDHVVAGVPNQDHYNSKGRGAEIPIVVASSQPAGDMKNGVATRVCKLCPKPAQFLCSGCRLAWYCSQECQLKEWGEHKRQCRRR